MKPIFTTRRLDKGWKTILTVAQSIKDSEATVKAGVIGEKAKAVTHDGSSLTNVELAMVNEFGSPDANVPERSWIRSAFATHRAEYRAMVKQMLPLIYRGKLTTKRALGLIGAKMASDIKLGVTAGEGIPPPNAPSTIRRKGSSRPLVASSKMVNSVSWELEGLSEGGHEE